MILTERLIVNNETNQVNKDETLPPFIITVDTEADNQWKGGGTISLENLKAIPRFQDVCEKYGFVPTYLVTYEVTTDQDTVEYLKKLWNEGKAEVGSHLHPWTTPPYFDIEEESRLMHFPSELDDEALRSKFTTLHQAVTQAFGREPKVFRAGRWGYDHRVGKLLKEFGYTADVSITPLVDWGRTVKNGIGRKLPNFVHASIAPWKIEDELYELPMSVLPRGPLFISRLANHLHRGTFFSQWCRIFKESTISELVYAYQRAQKLSLPYCMFMIHSSEFIVGSPYTKTEEDLEEHLTLFEQYLSDLHEMGVRGISVSDARKEIVI
jgi:hypothetical protein